MHLSQNARFVAAFPPDREFEHPPGAWFARQLQSFVGKHGWRTDELDNWRDGGWYVRCARSEADVEVRFLAGESDWILQVVPTRPHGWLRKASATPHDCYDVARAVDACLRMTGKASAIRWAWDGDPAKTPSAESPLAP